MFPDVPKEDLKSLYGALTQDLGEAFTAKGGAAQRAWEQSQRHYAAGQERIRNVLSRVSKAGDPEQIFAAARAGTKEGATRLTSLLNSLPAADRNVAAGAFIERLGRTAPDAEFSLDKFVTDWGKLSPEAKGALFKGPVARDMDTVAQAATDARNAGRALYNPSGSGRMIAHAAEVTGTVTGAMSMLFTGNPVAAAGLVGATALHATGNAYFAKAMHDPAFVRWLAQGTKVSIQNVTQHAARLYEIAKHTEDPDAAESEAAIALMLGAKGG
jgi:hypothetical protein